MRINHSTRLKCNGNWSNFFSNLLIPILTQSSSLKASSFYGNLIRHFSYTNHFLKIQENSPIFSTVQGFTKGWVVDLSIMGHLSDFQHRLLCWQRRSPFQNVKSRLGRKAAWLKRDFLKLRPKNRWYMANGGRVKCHGRNTEMLPTAVGRFGDLCDQSSNGVEAA